MRPRPVEIMSAQCAEHAFRRHKDIASSPKGGALGPGGNRPSLQLTYLKATRPNFWNQWISISPLRISAPKRSDAFRNFQGLLLRDSSKDGGH